MQRFNEASSGRAATVITEKQSELSVQAALNEINGPTRRAPLATSNENRLPKCCQLENAEVGKRLKCLRFLPLTIAHHTLESNFIRASALWSP